MVEVRVLGGHLAGLAWVALRTFVATMCVAALGGVVLASASYYFVRGGPWWIATIAVALVSAEAATIGVVLGWKRAWVLTLAHGLAELRLGRMLVRLLFERMQQLAAGSQAASGEAQPVERPEPLPLAEAQQRLDQATEEVAAAPEQGGWMRRAIRNPLLRAVRRCILTRFRAEGAAADGIDLLKVQQSLEGTIDTMLVGKVRKGLRLWTALALVGFPVAVALQTWGLLALWRIGG